jgi:WD40 repeat protein
VRTILLIAAALSLQAHSVWTASPPPPPVEFSGVYMDTGEEKIFFHCDGSPGEPSWWVNFAPQVELGRARYAYQGVGFPAQIHYMRVAGSLSPQGRYGTGFQSRELRVDSILEISDSLKCKSAIDGVPTPLSLAGTVNSVSAFATTSDDRTLVAIADNRGLVSVWETASARLIGRVRYENPPPPGAVPTTTIAFSHSNRLMAVGTQDGWAKVWSIPNGELIWELDNSAHKELVGAPGEEGWTEFGVFPVNSVAFSSNDSILVSAGGGRGYAWSMISGRKINSLFGAGRRHAIAPSQVAALRDPDRIVAYGPDGTLRLYATSGGLPLMVTSTQKVDLLLGPMKISPDQKRLAMRVAQDSVMLWSLEEGRPTRTLYVPHFFQGDFAFSPDGRRVAIPGNFAIYVWDTESGDPVTRIPTPVGRSRNLWFTQNGDSLIMSSVRDSALSTVRAIFPYSAQMFNRR